MAEIQKSLFENVDSSLPLMVLSDYYKGFGNDYHSALLSALGIEYYKEISESQLPKSLNMANAIHLYDNIQLLVFFYSL